MTTSYESIQAGQEGRLERLVGDSMLTRHVGGAGLFSTPAMIQLMEEAAQAALQPNLPDAHTTVGYEVCVRHLAPAKAGERIVVTARVEEVAGNKVHLAVECTKDDGDTLVGSGTHKRAIIPTLS